MTAPCLTVPSTGDTTRDQVVKKRPNTRSYRLNCTPPAWFGLAAGLLAVVAPMAAAAQVSLGTTVFLAQRHSTAVRIAEADLMKSQAALSETHDVYVPSVNFSFEIGRAHV